MNAPDLSASPHRRFNPLTREWVLVSPHRTQRPWQGQVEDVAAPSSMPYDPTCYLCPGNTRAGGVKNPFYTSTFVFDNDFAALKLGTPAWESDEEGLLVAVGEAGRCRVVCFSPAHDLTLARMEVADIEQVVNVWAEQFVDLGSDPIIRSVQIFENRGAMMGCSNPHPHGQIWANQHLPNELSKEAASQKAYFQAHSSTLLSDYLVLEERKQERLVCSNAHFVVLVPFWAIWPFETIVISRRPVASLDELDHSEHAALADILHQITVRYDNLFRTSFPYSMGFHQKPTDGEAHPYFHLHAHFHPPLLRSATVKKFQVGYELLAMPQRDITPEAAARQLRELPARHYLATS
jgi:UDPglucose--hexose-1-phosphate uridylyltransferase